MKLKRNNCWECKTKMITTPFVHTTLVGRYITMNSMSILNRVTPISKFLSVFVWLFCLHFSYAVIPARWGAKWGTSATAGNMKSNSRRNSICWKSINRQHILLLVSIDICQSLLCGLPCITSRRLNMCTWTFSNWQKSNKVGWIIW